MGSATNLSSIILLKTLGLLSTATIVAAPGSPTALDWMEDLLVKTYCITTQRIGKGKTWKGDIKKNESRVLNPVVRRSVDGWELKAELRHAELIIEQLGLTDANIVSSPGTATLTPLTADDDEGDDAAGLPSSSDATSYCNYLQRDRPDIQFAVKECCRMMAKPRRKA